MSKKIILFRHGIAQEAENFSGKDYDRPLVEKGEKQVKNVAKFVKKQFDISIDILVSSSALRTSQTSLILKKIFKVKKYIETQTLYMSGEKEYLKLIESSSNDIDTLCICGHNMDISNVIGIICKGTNVNMEKGSACIIKTNIENWSEILKGKNILLGYVSPKIVS